MSTSKNAKVQIETGRSVNDYAAMTDSGDHQVYTITGGTIFSGRSGYTPDVRPSGVVTGKGMITVSATNNEINIAAFTAYSKGTLKSVSAATATITRPATAGLSKVHSVTMASDGTIAIVDGTNGTDTTFSETRAAAGGPPLIPVYDVEIGQIRTTASTAAAITSDEVFQVIGTHTERSDYPLYDTNNVGLGESAEVSAQKNAHVKFNSVLPLIHTGTLPKAIYIKYYAPIFSDVSRASDFVPAEKSHSVSSQQIYGETIASVSESLGAGSFIALLSDGVTDALVAEKNQILTVKHFPDRNLTPYTLTQGTIGLGRTYPVANQNQAAVTISAEKESAEFAS